MYKVIKSFVDILDDGHKYNVGDSFPRSGAEVSDARLKKLAGSTNRQGTPLIEEVKKVDVQPAPLEKVEQEDAPKPEKRNRKSSKKA